MTLWQEKNSRRYGWHFLFPISYMVVFEDVVALAAQRTKTILFLLFGLRKELSLIFKLLMILIFSFLVLYTGWCIPLVYFTFIPFCSNIFSAGFTYEITSKNLVKKGIEAVPKLFRCY